MREAIFCALLDVIPPSARWCHVSPNLGAAYISDPGLVTVLWRAGSHPFFIARNNLVVVFLSPERHISFPTNAEL